MELAEETRTSGRVLLHLDGHHKSYLIDLERPGHAFSNYAFASLTQGKSWVSVRLMWVVSQRSNSLSTRMTR